MKESREESFPPLNLTNIDHENALNSSGNKARPKASHGLAGKGQCSNKMPLFSPSRSRPNIDLFLVFALPSRSLSEPDKWREKDL